MIEGEDPQGRASGDESPLLALRGISKAFPGVQALDGVDFELRAGEVTALVGENGAGKSTLLKILGGVVQADAGEIVLRGEPVEISDPRRAEKLNIAVIHQELNLAEQLSVAENVFVAHEPRTRLGFVDFARMRADTRTLLEALQTTGVDPGTEVGRLNLARRQMVEIAKALALDAEILVMDEPTSALSASEVSVLLRLIGRLRDRGVAVVYVSHRLAEVFAVADRITVLRDGRLVGVRERAASDPDEIVGMMVGRKLEEFYDEAERTTPGETVLEVRGLRRRPSPRTVALHDVSFTVRAGEILGVAGLVGAGRSEVARAMFGVDRVDACELLVKGRAVRPTSPRAVIAAGIGFMPEDRKLQGLFLDLAVRSNVSAASTGRLSRRGFIRARADREMAADAVERLSIRVSSVERPVRGLSGGNQQKVVLAKWLALDPEVLILDEPTRGVDIGAKAEIYRLIRRLVARGVAVVMISSELPEILELSDRVLVMREGAMAGELARTEADERGIMALATGTGKRHGG